MTLLELQAIRALPEDYLLENVHIRTVGNLVVVMQTSLPPIAFKDGKWIELTAEGTPEHVTKNAPSTRTAR